VLLRPVSRRYFEVLGIPLNSGRMFSEGTTGEAVINEALARVYWPGENAVGRVVHDVRDRGTVRQPYTIVGVVRDSYLTSLEKIDPVIFKPTTRGTFLTRGGPASAERIRAAALALGSDATITARPLKDNLRKYLEDARTGATLGWSIGLLALALAMVGVFGVFAYAVEERRREIGIRLALGAARAQIVRLLMAA
jgi:hypothetical protein